MSLKFLFLQRVGSGKPRDILGIPSPRAKEGRRGRAKKWNFLETYRSPKSSGSGSSSHPSFGCPLGSLAIPHELSPLADLLSFLVAVVLDSEAWLALSWTHSPRTITRDTGPPHEPDRYPRLSHDPSRSRTVRRFPWVIAASSCRR